MKIVDKDRVGFDPKTWRYECQYKVERCRITDPAWLIGTDDPELVKAKAFIDPAVKDRFVLDDDTLYRIVCQDPREACILVFRRILVSDRCACGGVYRSSTYCGAKVCEDCDDHKGLERCYCGWSKTSPGRGRAELVEMGETIGEDEY